MSAEQALGAAEGYEVLRRAAGAVPVERDVVRVGGSDASSYLQGQCSQDVEGLEPGTSADALLLSPQGRLHSLVRVTRLDDESFLVDVDKGFGSAVVERLLRFRLRVAVEIEMTSWRCLAVRGPQAAEVTTAASDGAARHDPEVLAVPFTWGAASGVDLLGEQPELPRGVPRCGEHSWEALRIEAGVPLMGRELDERTIPAEAGLVERAVSLTKGCYTGQELVARLDARGSNVARRLRGLLVTPEEGSADEAGRWASGDEAASDGAPPAPGTAVLAEDRQVGTITSSAWSPRLGIVALAYLHRSVDPLASLDIASTGRPLRAQAVDLPFA